MMTTTEIATATGAILAIDLGKYKRVVCHYHSAADQRFTTIRTTRH